MPGIKELKTRIKSIGSTRKITRAMQMVSAAKMRKSQNAVLQSRPYAFLAWEMVENVSKKGKFEHPLLKLYPDAKKIGVVLLTSNKGLVGSLNTNLLPIIKQLNPNFRQTDDLNRPEVITEIITYGKKGHVLAVRLKKDILADFPKPDRGINIEEIYSLSQFITQAYASGKYKKIFIVHNLFVSTIQQKPIAKQIFPIVEELRISLETEKEQTEIEDMATIFEPTPKNVVEHLIPRIVESQIYETIMESDASEHSARMVMMKNATEAAGDLISDLTLTYNQLRQNKITTELAEITAGKIALE